MVARSSIMAVQAHTAQVIILGDSGVGKTSLMNQYVCRVSNPSLAMD